MHTSPLPEPSGFGGREFAWCPSALASEKKMIWYRSTTTYRVEVLLYRNLVFLWTDCVTDAK
jgi:hypothetical protein